MAFSDLSVMLYPLHQKMPEFPILSTQEHSSPLLLLGIHLWSEYPGQNRKEIRERKRIIKSIFNNWLPRLIHLPPQSDLHLIFRKKGHNRIPSDLSTTWAHWTLVNIILITIIEEVYDRLLLLDNTTWKIASTLDVCLQELRKRKIWGKIVYNYRSSRGSLASLEI